MAQPEIVERNAVAYRMARARMRAAFRNRTFAGKLSAAHDAADLYAVAGRASDAAYMRDYAAQLIIARAAPQTSADFPLRGCE